MATFSTDDFLFSEMGWSAQIKRLKVRQAIQK